MDLPAELRNMIYDYVFERQTIELDLGSSFAPSSGALRTFSPCYM